MKLSGETNRDARRQQGASRRLCKNLHKKERYFLSWVVTIDAISPVISTSAASWQEYCNLLVNMLHSGKCAETRSASARTKGEVRALYLNQSYVGSPCPSGG